jgi:uncharacterized protein YukJ
MPIANYGVLKGKAFDRKKATSQNEHFQILINRGNNPHRIAINTKSSEAPSEVLFYANDDFHHDITEAILQAGLPNGFTALSSQPGGLALDFIRRNFFDLAEMVPLPSNSPGDNNDLNDKLDFFRATGNTKYRCSSVCFWDSIGKMHLELINIFPRSNQVPVYMTFI